VTIGAKMSRRPRRTHSAAFKAKVALAAVRGDKILAELAWQHDAHSNQITDWKNQLLSWAADVFGGEASSRPTSGAAVQKWGSSLLRGRPLLLLRCSELSLEVAHHGLQLSGFLNRPGIRGGCLV
jgi:transposase-like protein